MRGPDQLQTSAGRQIFWLLAVSTQIKSLLGGNEYPAFINSWLDDFHTQNPETDVDFVRLSNFVSQIASLMAEIQQHNESPILLLAGPDVPELWSRVQALEAILNQALFDRPLGEPVDLDAVFLHNQYRACFIRLAQCFLDLIGSDLVQQGPDTDHDQVNSALFQLTSDVQSLSAATISTVPYVLGSGFGAVFEDIQPPQPGKVTNRPVGWFDVLRLLWPLRFMASRRHILGQTQFDYVYTVLQHISSRYGIRHATAPFLYGRLEELG